MNAKQLLEKTLDLIRSRETWCQNAPRIWQGEVKTKRDLMEALTDAARSDGYWIGSEAWDLARDALFAETAGMGITRFNDAAATTHAHVFALVERAIAKV
jgi:hypothetical protein